MLEHQRNRSLRMTKEKIGFVPPRRRQKGTRDHQGQEEVKAIPTNANIKRI